MVHNETKLCRICSNGKNNKIFLIPETMFGTGERFTYFQCSECGCLQISEFPEDLSKYYRSDYYSFNLSSKYFKNPVERIARKFRDRYAVLNRGLLGKMLYRYLPNESFRSLSKVKLTESTRILDVGCGTGFLLYSLREIGFRELLGIDPYLDETIEYENGLTILKDSIQSIGSEWDIIMFHHSFEHLHNPLETLQSVAKLLCKSGICLIRIPTVSSYAWEHYGINWVQLDAPRHSFLHSLESMKILAAKADLDIYDMYYDSTDFQFWGSEQNQKGVHQISEASYRVKPSRSSFSKSEIRKFRKRAEELNLKNQGDQVAMYLGKQ